MGTNTVITMTEAQERGAVSVEEARHLLGLGRSAAYDAIRSGEIPSVRVGRRLLVPVPALLRLLDGHRAPVGA